MHFMRSSVNLGRALPEHVSFKSRTNALKRQEMSLQIEKTFSFVNLPVQACEIAPVENFEANAVDHFRVVFPSPELVVRHQTEKNCDEIFDAHQAQILPE